MYCKSLWIKASDKCINVPVGGYKMNQTVIRESQSCPWGRVQMLFIIKKQHCTLTKVKNMKSLSMTSLSTPEIFKIDI